MAHLLDTFRILAAGLVVCAGISLPARADDNTTVHFTVDATKDVKPISPFVYGVNSELDGPLSHCTLTRAGGNRMTAYNWVNNASNAGNDWHFQNDGIMGGGDVPGGALTPRIENALSHHASIILTIPLTGYVSADKNGDGDVRRAPDYLQTRFQPSVAHKGAAFTSTPAANSPVVFQDEFVNWVKVKFPATQNDPHTPLFYSLDNEPDLWASTHAEIHPKPATYAEIVERSVEYAMAIKAVSPRAVVLGPVSYGWQGYVNLQNAPDAGGRDFLNFYLAQMQSAEKANGKRLVDALDVHWYPEAQGGGVRISANNTTPAVAAARVQAPRSLWDKTYTETSWITQWSTKGPIALIPRLTQKIAENYPGTKLALTEYNYGGGAHISGAIAQADVLGILGREGVFAACEWPVEKDETFIDAAFEMFRNFDGKGGAFGSESVSASTDNIEASSIYASIDGRGDHSLTLVLINKTDHPLKAELTLTHAPGLLSGRIFQLTAAKAEPRSAGTLATAGAGLFSYEMPPSSVSTLCLDRAAAK